MELATFEFLYKSGRETTRHILRAENAEESRFLHKLRDVIDIANHGKNKSALKLISVNMDNNEIEELGLEEN